MPTFLVTGGAGFIGSHLTEELLRRGHRVLVLDDLSSGSIENLSQVRNNPRLEIAVESTSSRGVLMELLDRAEDVFHMAATVGVFNIIERATRPYRSPRPFVGNHSRIYRRYHLYAYFPQQPVLCSE